MPIISIESLGLAANGSVGDDYDTVRRDCFHRGVDYKTNGKETPFLAAVYGRVIEPYGGVWGTITVAPFGSSDIIQFLHCSSRSVRLGEIVAPWTQLGYSGDVCPPGTCTGIHLHLQVLRPSGSPKHSCWNRNYLDPKAWYYENPIVGTWTRQFRYVGSAGSQTLHTQTLSIHSDAIPTVHSFVDALSILITLSSGKTCILEAVSKYKLTFQSYSNNATNVIIDPAGATIRQVGGNGDCRGFRLNQSRITGGLLLNGDQLLVSGELESQGGPFVKTGFLPASEVELEHNTEPAASNPDDRVSLWTRPGVLENISFETEGL